jgi:hypothetical protein
MIAKAPTAASESALNHVCLPCFSRPFAMSIAELIVENALADTRSALLNTTNATINKTTKRIKAKKTESDMLLDPASLESELRLFSASKDDDEFDDSDNFNSN